MRLSQTEKEIIRIGGQIVELQTLVDEKQQLLSGLTKRYNELFADLQKEQEERRRNDY